MSYLWKQSQHNKMQKEYRNLLEKKYNCVIAYDSKTKNYSTIIKNKFCMAKTLNGLNAMLQRIK